MSVDILIQRQHVRGSVEGWQRLEKVRVMLLTASRNKYVDHDVILSICEDITTEQDRLIQLRPKD